MTQETVLVYGNSHEMKGNMPSFFKALPFRFLPASSFENALKWLKDPYPIHLIVIIPELKQKNFLKEFEKFRKKPEAFDIPIFVILPKEELDLAEPALEFCNDFILDDASETELLQRMKKLLHRKPPHHDSHKGEINIGNLKISLSTFQAFKNGTELKLTPIEYKLIHFLYKNKTRVLKREELLREVWGYKDLMQTRTIDTYMKRLRAKLGTEGKLIETLRGVGYRLKT